MADVRTAAFRKIRALVTEERLDEIDQIAAVYASSAESVDEKARRLLIEGRLVVKELSIDEKRLAPIVAVCRGDSGELYSLGYDRSRSQWRCTCEGRSDRCSHLLALRLVTERPS